jgi:membrane glycosyltransferase
MSNLRTIASTQPEEVASVVDCSRRRLSICVLMTALNIAVVTTYAGMLYRATAGHPLQIAGVTVLFAALFASLLHVWIVGLRGR